MKKLLTAAGNQGSPVAGRSNSYQNGYWFAYHNAGHQQPLGTAVELEGVHAACAGTATVQAPVQGLNEQEWTHGCEDALQKMGYTLAPTPTGPTVDCSKPENRFYGACF